MPFTVEWDSELYAIYQSLIREYHKIKVNLADPRARNATITMPLIEYANSIGEKMSYVSEINGLKQLNREYLIENEKLKAEIQNLEERLGIEHNS